LATRSAAKAHRQSLKRRLRNRAVKSSTKTAIKRANEAIAAGDPEVAREAVRGAIQELDRAAKKGVIHPNNAARRKSRLFLKFNAAVAALQVPADETTAKPKATKKASADKKPAARAAAAKKGKK
jgi:small subunit ribosomal protein S20